MGRLILIFVGDHLATKILIGKLPATRGVWVIIGQANDGVHLTMHLMHPT
jgi:hypothetical protein